MFDFELLASQSCMPICILLLPYSCFDCSLGGLEEPVIRPYTPISTQRLVGKFELMIKIYEQGAFSQFIAQLPIGGTVEFKHIPFNVKIQYPFRKQVGMLCGGTGVTPMLQALHAVLGTEGDETEKVAMVYGSRSSDDILAGPTLDAWAAESGGKFTCTHVLSHEPEGSAWPGARGFISRQLVETHLPAPGDDTHVFVCGPPAMYEALCGPRDQKEVTGLLAEMGYTAEQVFKF